MGYVTRRAERAAIRGGTSYIGFCLKLAAGAVVLGWPLGIMHHGHTTTLGWIIGAVWWAVLALLFVGWLTARPAKPAGTRRR